MIFRFPSNTVENYFQAVKFSVGASFARLRPPSFAHTRIRAFGAGRFSVGKYFFSVGALDEVGCLWDAISPRRHEVSRGTFFLRGCSLGDWGLRLNFADCKVKARPGNEPREKRGGKMVIVNGEKWMSPEDLDEPESRREEVIELPESSDDLIIIRNQEENQS